MLQAFLAEDPEIDFLCGAPSCSKTYLLFCDDLLYLRLESILDDLQHDLTMKADGSVVLAQLQVAFLWECDN